MNNFLAKIKTKATANSPMICLIGGCVTLVAAVVTTATAGMKTKTIYDDYKEAIAVREADVTPADEEPSCEIIYSEEDFKKDKKTLKCHLALDLFKVYAVPAALTTISLVLFVEGNRILEKRNSALSTALAATQTMLNGYRHRVASYLGEEKEKEVWNGLEKVKTVDENGNEIEEEKVTIDHTLYDRCFDECCETWRKDPYYNQQFLFECQEELNRLLQDRCQGDDGVGIVTLNEVYSLIGFQKVPEGQTIGWYYEANGHKGVIDFGLYDSTDKSKAMFVNCLEKSVWLNFNFDGDIISVAKKKGAIM